MRVLIVGCGYVGTELGRELVVRGHEVFGMRRHAGSARDLSAAGITAVVADVTQRGELFRIPGGFDWVVNTVSSSKGDAHDYRSVYLQGTRNLLEWLPRASVRKYVYTSSTSVYGQTDGSWVNEVSPTNPRNDTSRLLVETEQLLLEATRETNFPGVLLRVAGIYGPGRGHVFRQFLSGEACLCGAGDRIMNMIHREDVVRAILCALEKGATGGVYNVADDEPVTQHEFFSWLSGRLGKPMPPVLAECENATPKRGLTHKRVSNQKLRKELACELKYPTFRQGYSAEIARLQAAGQLSASAGP